MQCTVFDRSTYRVTHREYTDEGFLRVPGRVARTGIQEYLARELGLDGDPSRVIRVYRSADEVFKPESLSTYASADVTDNHPAGLVDADNYRSVVRGIVAGPGRQDGDFVVCDLIVKDKAAITAINAGKCELSAGYTAVYEPTAGVTEDGQQYDYIQRDIKINHVAIVERARAGANARVFDHNPEKHNMTHKVILDSGRSVEVQDEATALLVSDTIERLNTKVADAEAKADQAQAAADAANEQLQAAVLASSDEAIAARVAEVTKCQEAARKVAGDGFTCDSLMPVEIKRAAMAVARPKVEWADKSVAYVEAAFDMEAEKAKDEEEEEGKEKMSKDSVAAQLAQLSQDAATKQTEDAKPSAYQAYKNTLANAHKGA